MRGDEQHRHARRRRQRHPLRDAGPRAIGLTNDQEAVVAQARSSENLDLIALTRVVRVVNADKLDKLFAGTMCLLRPV